MQSYQAPVLCEAPEPDIIPESYSVFLHSGYSLDQHKATIGDKTNLAVAISTIFNDTPSAGELLYMAELDDTSLAAVRADVGVDLVECNRRVHRESSPGG